MVGFQGSHIPQKKPENHRLKSVGWWSFPGGNMEPKNDGFQVSKLGISDSTVPSSGSMVKFVGRVW